MAVNNFSTFVTGARGGTLHSRINGSSTGAAITCNLSVGSAGLVQDTTHTDNLNVGDDYDWQFSDTNTSFTYDFFAADFTSMNGVCLCIR